MNKSTLSRDLIHSFLVLLVPLFLASAALAVVTNVSIIVVDPNETPIQTSTLILNPGEPDEQTIPEEDNDGKIALLLEPGEYKVEVVEKSGEKGSGTLIVPEGGGNVMLTVFPVTALAQEEYKTNTNTDGEVIETNNPNYQGYFEYAYGVPVPTQWIPYTSKCKTCGSMVEAYNTAMQNLFAARGWIAFMEKSSLEGFNGLTISDATEAQLEKASKAYGEQQTLMSEALPALQKSVQELELSTNYMRRMLEECERQCPPAEESISAISLPATEISKDPAISFDWNGPYQEVCGACREAAAELNEIRPSAIENANQINAYNAKIAYLEMDIAFNKSYASLPVIDAKEYKKRASKYRKELKSVQKNLKKALKSRKKIVKIFDKTFAQYNKCIKTCPVKKTACVFPNDKHESMLIGPNDQYGSSAQTKKEIRDKATGALKGVASQAIGSLFGFGAGVGDGGGSSSGPKTAKDPTKGEFTRISSGNTDLDIRASWKDGQLIVSTDIADTPNNGTFHAQWLEDKNGKTYLPVRYLIIRLYLDWELTVSWTEDRYVDGEHVFHDEGSSVTEGSDLLGTWELFKGAEGIGNSIWGMLGFETAVKGVKHLGAVYDVPQSVFDDPCQVQLVTHISQPKTDPVSTIPLVGDFFKHNDASKKSSEMIIFIQPHILNEAE